MTFMMALITFVIVLQMMMMMMTFVIELQMMMMMMVTMMVMMTFVKADEGLRWHYQTSDGRRSSSVPTKSSERPSPLCSATCAQSSDFSFNQPVFVFVWMWIVMCICVFVYFSTALQCTYVKSFEFNQAAERRMLDTTTFPSSENFEYHQNQTYEYQPPSGMHSPSDFVAPKTPNMSSTYGQQQQQSSMFTTTPPSIHSQGVLLSSPLTPPSPRVLLSWLDTLEPPSRCLSHFWPHPADA